MYINLFYAEQLKDISLDLSEKVGFTRTFEINFRV